MKNRDDGSDLVSGQFVCLKNNLNSDRATKPGAAMSINQSIKQIATLRSNSPNFCGRAIFGIDYTPQ
jgi:hypothetical protein